MIDRVRKINNGIMLSLMATFIYSVMSMLIKLVSKNIPSEEIVFFRSLIGTIIVLVYMRANNYRFEAKNKWLLFTRGLLGAISVLCSFYTISKIKLGEATILFQMTPVFVAVFGYFILKEKLPRFFYWLITASIIGCLLVIKPSFTNWHTIPALIGVLSSVLAAGAYMCVRKLCKEHNVYIVVLYFSVVATLAPIPILIKTFVMPGVKDLIVLTLIGVVATLYQFLMTKAYSLEKAGIVSMVTYTGLFFNIFWGLVIWGEMLDIKSLMGGVLILASCIVLSYKTYADSTGPVR